MPAKRKILENPRSDSKDNYFNYKLKELRLLTGCIVKGIAKEAGVSAPTIYAYERLRAFPPKRVARRIVDYLSKSLEEELRRISGAGIKVGLDVEDVFPEKLREITAEVARERGREKRQLEFEYVGSNLNEISYRLREEPAILTLGEDSPLEVVIKRERGEKLREKIEEVLATLTYREREIIKLRFGLYDGYTYTYEEISRIFNITRERVRQIEARAIIKLQHPSRAEIPYDLFK